MTTNTIAIGKDTILRDVLSWLDSNKSLLQGVRKREIAKLAQKHIPVLPSKARTVYFRSCLGTGLVGRNVQPGRRRRKYPILRICKGNIFA